MKIRNGWLLGAMVGGLIAAAAAPASAGTVRHHHHRASVPVSDTRNWAGYADQACSTCKFSKITATFTLPALDCAVSGSGSWSLLWAGLDGWFGSDPVEQAGAGAFCQSSSLADYYLFEDNYPKVPRQWTPAGGLQAGDQITVTIQVVTGGYKFTIVTPHTTDIQTLPCGEASCPDSSAEAVVEDPGSSSVPPLADFGTASFTGVQVTSRNGTAGTMASGPLWALHEAVMVGDNGTTVLAQPGALSGYTFPVTWRAAS